MLKQKQDGTIWSNAACRKLLMLEEEPAPLQTSKGSTSSANADGKSRALSHTWTLQTTAPRGLILHKAEEDLVSRGFFSQRIVLPK